MTITEQLEADIDELIVETEGSYRDHRYAVMCIQESHYAGYVQLTDEELDVVQLRSKVSDTGAYVSPDISVHGGITYGPDEDNWVGFDYAHAGDVCEHPERKLETMGCIREEHIWFPNDVFDDVQVFIDQVIAAVGRSRN
jgi:hypothetical protein